jgi:hypothetical protein
MASSGSGPFWYGAATWNVIVVALNVNAVCVSVLIWIGLSLSVVVILMVIVACAIGIELGATCVFHVSVVTWLWVCRVRVFLGGEIRGPSSRLCGLSLYPYRELRIPILGYGVRWQTLRRSGPNRGGQRPWRWLVLRIG